MGQITQEWTKKNLSKTGLHTFYLVHSSIIFLIWTSKVSKLIGQPHKETKF